jgi:hypothetical protein
MNSYRTLVPTVSSPKKQLFPTQAPTQIA